MADVNVDFIGVGAQKSGTTWLFDMLSEHPEVSFGEVKELNFFSKRKFFLSKDTGNYEKGLDWYRSKIDYDDSKVNGEISVDYMLDEGCADRIKRHCPDDVKLFAVLRDPVERAHSHYHFSNEVFDIGDDFEDCVFTYDEYLERSRYYEKLKPYFDAFEKDQIHIMFFDDLKDDPEGVLHGLESFLGVSQFTPETVDEASNKTRYPRFQAVNKAFTVFYSVKDTGFGRWLWDQAWFQAVKNEVFPRIKNWNLAESDRDPVSPEVEQRVRQAVEDDVERLEGLLSVDLSAWKP